MAYRTAGRVGSSVRCWPFCKVAPSVQVGYWGSERDSILPRAIQHWAQCHGGELWVRRRENRVGRALLETGLERISRIIIILEILMAATISWVALVPGSVLSALLALSLDSSQQPYENNTVSSPISWVRKLRLGRVNIPKANPEAWCSERTVQSSPCTSTLDTPLWTLSEGRCRMRGRLTAPHPVTSRQQAGGEWPGVHRAASVTGHWPRGRRRQKKEPDGGTQARERDLPCPSLGSGPRTPPQCLLLWGWGGSLEFSLPPQSRSGPQLSAAWSR